MITANHLGGGLRGPIRNLNTDQPPEPINSAEPSQLSFPRTKFTSRLEIKVVFKMRQDSLFITTVVSLVFNHRGKNVLGLLLKD